jgi:tetratricopeptide (TPR) repeat protein
LKTRVYQVILISSYLYLGTICGAWAVPENQRAQSGELAKQAFTYLKSGEEQKALESINKAIEIEPAPSSYRLRAEVELTTNDFIGAMADAKKAKKAEPNYEENMRMVGRVYEAMGKTSEALKEYDEAIKIQPENHVFRKDRAHLLERAGQFSKAILDYTVAIRTVSKQNRGPLYESRAKCYMKTKEYQFAVDDFTSALATTYGRSNLLRSRSAAYKLLGKPDLAKKDLQGAASMDEVFEPPSALGKDN